MAVNFQLPASMERSLRSELRDLDEFAREAVLVEFYRQDRITQLELAEAMQLTRMEVEALLKKHNVTEDLPTTDEYNAALAALRANANP